MGISRWRALGAMGLVSFWLGAASAGAATLAKGPYLIVPETNTAMRVLWQADVTPSASSVEWGSTTAYGQSSGPLTESGPLAGEHQFSFTISGLAPGTRYCYRVHVDGESVSSTFFTAPADDAQETVVYAFGDTRTDAAMMNTVLGRLRADAQTSPALSQSLVIHVGDWVADGDVEADWQGDFFNRSYTNSIGVMSEMAIMGARGNHEATATVLRKYWPYALPDCHYSFDYGPIHFTVIDQYVPYAAGSAQYDWIVSDLASTAKPFKVAVFHEPAYSAGGRHPNNQTAQAALCPLFRQYGVKLVLNGHNHYYSRCSVDGIQHLTVGGGGVPTEAPGKSAQGLVIGDVSHHFARISVACGVLSVAVIRPDGSVIDSFRADAPAGTQPPTAEDDHYTFKKLGHVSAARGVLSNDTNDGRSKLTAALVTPPVWGTVALEPDGSFIYTPAIIGARDVFTYTAGDASGTSAPASVRINGGFNPDNRAPVAHDDRYTLPKKHGSVQHPGVLVNDTDEDGDRLMAVLVSPPTGGTLILKADGSFTYTAFTPGAPDRFTYRAFDGQAESDVATVLINP